MILKMILYFIEIIFKTFKFVSLALAQLDDFKSDSNHSKSSFKKTPTGLIPIGV
jgi:hypothetical protein